MTEQEAIKDISENIKPYVGGKSLDMAIKALEEVQMYHDGKLCLVPEDVFGKICKENDEYKEIGTVEEIKSDMEELKRWRTDKTNPKIKNMFANTSTLICHNCDYKDEYIEELEAEMEEYRAIGTVEECRAAVEKMKAKKPHKNYEKFSGVWCSCGKYLGKGYFVDKPNYCSDCGTKLDWSDGE